MPKPILIDEMHLSVFIARRLPAAESDSIRRTLRSRRFQDRLREAALGVFRQYPSLGQARFTLSR